MTTAKPKGSHLLRVTAHDHHVGDICFDQQQDRYDFAYADSWLDRVGAFAISPHIPLGTEGARPDVVKRFLQNLLPEGDALEVISVNHQISKFNTFGLVALLGKEPVGALAFELEDPSATQIVQPIRRAISSKELSARIRNRLYEPFPVWDGKVRLSVAGSQDKLQILLEGEQMALADGSLASTHILKPEPRGTLTPFMVANEHFCMTLASRMGLPVAPVAIKRVPEPILLIERFDRRMVMHPDGQGLVAVERKHVIDGCQALDLPVACKYERNFDNDVDVKGIRAGVSFELLFKQLPFLEPVPARIVLLRWALLQLLLGNSDAHGKNISFFVQGDRLVPAPFYDLVSVNVYGDRVEQEFAMAYGDSFLSDDVGAFGLADFAMRISMSPAVVARELTALATQARMKAPELANESFYEGQERDFVRQTAQFVVSQADRFLKVAPMVPEVDRSLL